jgi:DNA-binding response OmpR family regulator
MRSNSRPRVLCVDENDDSRAMLITLLRLELLEAKAVRTAVQALSLIQTERFDLYLLDARLPGLDGFDLCRRVRKSDPHTPILFFSGAAYEADKRKGIEAGANAYLIKPDIYGLVATIRHLFFHAERAIARAVDTSHEVSVPRLERYEIAAVRSVG